MMQSVGDNLVAVLAMPPDPILPAAGMGFKKPATLAEVPAICLELELDGSDPGGVGRIARSGEIMAKNSAVVVVTADSEVFSPDRRTLRLWPLPLKKNPATIQSGPGAYEVQVKNISDPSQPISYQQVLKPSQPDEYTLDVPRARLVFGGPQTPADTLEVTHWTVSWRDDILVNRYRGNVWLEIWALSLSEIDSLCRKLQGRLAENSGLWRQRGFLSMRPTRLAAAEQFRQTPVSGSSFSVWKQRLAYGFAFEAEEVAELSEGLPIKQVMVEMDQELPETFTVL